MRVTVIGAGVAGLCCAVELAERGADVEVLERAASLGEAACSWYAGGMLAPGVERESAPPLVAELGAESLPWWRAHIGGVVQGGSLVLAHARDAGELRQLARRTEGYEWLDAAAVAALEPALAGRFAQALLFAGEGHLEPRAALAGLTAWLAQRGVPLRFGVEAQPDSLRDRPVVDCRGLAARDVLSDLRGVKGEMLVLKQPEITLSRPLRVLPPRMPVYIVPRAGGQHMVGATMLESDAPSRISARSMLELLSAAYALNPAFGEAEIVEIGSGVRPAFPDNLPRLRRRGRILHVNGLYRHGFLLAPAVARRAAQMLLEDRCFPELDDEDPRERRLA